MLLTKPLNRNHVFNGNKTVALGFALAIMAGGISHAHAADPSTSTIGDSKFRIITTGSVNVAGNGIKTLVIKCATNEQIISTGIDTTQGFNGKGFGVIDDAPTSHRKWVKRLRNLNAYPVKVAIRAICNRKK